MKALKTLDFLFLYIFSAIFQVCLQKNSISEGLFLIPFLPHNSLKTFILKVAAVKMFPDSRKPDTAPALQVQVCVICAIFAYFISHTPVNQLEAGKDFLYPVMGKAFF